MPLNLLGRGGLRRSGGAPGRPPTIDLGPFDLALLPRAQWGLIVEAQPWTIVSNVAAAAAMTAYLTLGTDQPEALWWLLAIVLTAAGRFLTLLRWGRTTVLGRTPRRARAILLVGLAASGGLWALAAALFIPTGDVAVEATFFVFAAGLCAAAAATLNAVLGASLAFAAPFLGTLIVRLIADGDANAITLAISVGAFAVCVYGVAYAGSRQTERALRLLLANRRLQRNLTEARAEKRSAEEDALQSELGRLRAESAASAKGRFLGLIGHELKTPLHGVIGFANMIKQEMSGPIGQAAYVDYAEEISRSGMGLLRLIDKILLITRTSAKGADFQPVETDIESMAAQVRRDVLANAERPGRRIDIDVSPAGALVHGDPRLLRQAIFELLENADKFSPADAPILIECRAPPGGAAILRVCDNGAGIPPEKAATLMQPFVQADDTYARQTEGLGIGLALARHVMDLHGGEIGIVPNPDGGTIVELSLQAAPSIPTVVAAKSDVRPAKTLRFSSPDEQKRAASGR